jgi:DNA replication protein DnaC
MSATDRDDLTRVLKRLRLSGLLESLAVRVQDAADARLSYDEFLRRILRDELDRRDGRQLDVRIRRAQFEHNRTLEDFDFAFNPGIPREKVLSLGTCAFVSRKENVLFLGPTGTGKSHLAQALGHRACRQNHAVRFVAAQDMFTELRAARGDGTWDRKLERLIDVDVLIIDDLGLRPLRGDEPYDLHEVVRHRHQKRSTIVTSNRGVPEWGTMFPDPLLAAATVDRLLQDATVLLLTGDSYRNPPSQKRPKTKVPATP